MAPEPNPRPSPRSGAEVRARQDRDTAKHLAVAREHDAAKHLAMLREQAAAKHLAMLREQAEEPGTSGSQPAASAPDPSGERGLGELNLTDPKAMRALAHPVRMSLLELLGVTRTLTATQASELLGESPANCAFHLRTLAKYGFVREAGGGRGRERPWERMQQSINLSSLQEDPQAAMAAKALAQLWHERWLERIRRVFSSGSWPPDWEEAAQSNRSVEFLTREEAVKVGAEIRAILDRYRDRQEHPSRRPAGALPVEFVTFGFPVPELAGLDLPREGPREGATDEPDETGEQETDEG